MTPRRPYQDRSPTRRSGNGNGDRDRQRHRELVAPTVRVPTSGHNLALQCSLSVFDYALLVLVVAGDGTEHTMTQLPGLEPSQVPPESRNGLPPRRRRSCSRGRKRLTAGTAALGLLLAIGAIASATEGGKTGAKVADPATRSTTA